MKIAKLLHNPSAGDEDHSKKELISLIRTHGYECNYASIKEKGWDEFEEETDFIIIAGGDGTVRKAVKKIIERKLIDKQFPIAVLPMGTANNIATTLGFNSKEDIGLWEAKNIKRIDIGKIAGNEGLFFLEGFGYGVFPRLMKEMKVKDNESDTPEKELQTALKVLMEIIDSYKAKSCVLDIDGIDHSGNYLLVEIMNIRSIGPNMTLAPMADPGDGLFEIVLISENQRDEFKQYISDKLNGLEKPFKFSTIQGKIIKIKWDGMLMHLDDELIDNEKKEVKIEVMEGVLKFLFKP
ncbi:diacylglycerol kinase family protein [Pedobacter sp. P351]|uniref:diacylglycerol/lipid kinase family protein n=1 Tax=Pedobacter superstes TaxID=3133441 RepID=UPI00309A77CD